MNDAIAHFSNTVLKVNITRILHNIAEIHFCIGFFEHLILQQYLLFNIAAILIYYHVILQQFCNVTAILSREDIARLVSRGRK